MENGDGTRKEESDSESDNENRYFLGIKWDEMR